MARIRHFEGADWLGDQDVMRYICRLPPEVILEIESFGLPTRRSNRGLRGRACDNLDNSPLDKFHLDWVSPALRCAPQIKVTSSNDVPTLRELLWIMSDMFIHTSCVQNDVEVPRCSTAKEGGHERVRSDRGRSVGIHAP